MRLTTGSRSVIVLPEFNIIYVLTVYMRAISLTRLRGRTGSSERSLFTHLHFFYTILYKLAHTDDSLTRTFAIKQ